MKLDAAGMQYQTLNAAIYNCPDKKIVIEHCLGQRYIASGLSGRELYISGTPGNALGAYLDGSRISLMGNAQEATGDTMNDGEIVIYGSAGDATGYAMRGGRIMIQGNTGYRAGIHMKAYADKAPALVIGGCAGSFLGEYQAGGVIVVLGLGSEGQATVGNFCAAGMHGGMVFLRTRCLPKDIPQQVTVREMTPADCAVVQPHLEAFCREFQWEMADLRAEPFYVLAPNEENPYQQLYTFY